MLRMKHSARAGLLGLAVLALFALPGLAQSGGILGVVAPGDTPQLVQEGLLYLAAREGLYRINTLTQGPDRPGK